LDEIDYLDLNKAAKTTTYNGHFEETAGAIPEKKRREPLGEREMRLQRKLEEMRNRHRMRNMKDGEEAVRKCRQVMGVIGFTNRLAEVDDLKYFGQGGGLASYYTDTLIQRVKGEIVKKGVDCQIAKINQNKYSFYELVRLRKDIRKPP
jgi:lipase chaperone LimK